MFMDPVRYAKNVFYFQTFLHLAEWQRLTQPFVIPATVQCQCSNVEYYYHSFSWKQHHERLIKATLKFEFY